LSQHGSGTREQVMTPPTVTKPIAVGETTATGHEPLSRLLPHHLECLHGSGLSDATIADWGCYSIEPDQKWVLNQLGFGQLEPPALALPMIPPDQTKPNRDLVMLKPDMPRRDTRGHINKYEARPKSRNRVHVPLAIRDKLADLTMPLVITEGQKKAEKAAQEGICAVALPGVWNWRDRVGESSFPISDFDLIQLAGRKIWICFDSDAAQNPHVRRAESDLAIFLGKRGARVSIKRLPPGQNGAKVGLDDFLLAQTVEEFWALPDHEPDVERGAGVISTERNWPDPPEESAFYGLAGDIVRHIEPHTESSLEALLIQTLVSFGNMMGRTAYFVAEGSSHFMNLFAVLVGVTSGGRKGSSWAQVLRLFRHTDSDWAGNQLQSGLSSGEGLISAVRDPSTKHEPIRQKGRVVAYQDVEADPGVSDKRLLVFESEFASPLRMMARDGNILSVVIRQAWDTGDLRTMTKNSPTKATNAHISIVGHVTRDELRRELSTTDMGNGFANRFLWVCTARSKELPEGGNITDAELSPFATRLRDAVAFARQVGEMKRDDGVREMWERTYHEVTASTPGLLGAVVSRAAPQIMRLACLYALLDHSAVVRAEHLLAAVALWEYCQGSARFIFGDALGDPTADTVLEALRSALNGLDRTAISSLFGRHKRTEEISRALAVLQEHGLAKVQPPVCDGSGRPSEVWFAVGSAAKKEK
jgi:hypothetical protein